MEGWIDVLQEWCVPPLPFAFPCSDDPKCAGGCGFFAPSPGGFCSSCARVVASAPTGSDPAAAIAAAAAGAAGARDERGRAIEAHHAALRSTAMPAGDFDGLLALVGSKEALPAETITPDTVRGLLADVVLTAPQVRLVAWVAGCLGGWVAGWLGGWVAGCLGVWVAGWLGAWVRTNCVLQVMPGSSSLLVLASLVHIAHCT